MYDINNNSINRMLSEQILSFEFLVDGLTRTKKRKAEISSMVDREVCIEVMDVNAGLCGFIHEWPGRTDRGHGCKVMYMGIHP